MSMKSYSFKESLEPIDKELNARISRRESLIRDSRTVISLSSRSIVKIHTGQYDDAAKDLILAKTQLKDLKKVASEDLAHYLVSPETEYVEASVIKSVASGKAIPQYTDLNVSGAAFLLGLMDAVGELKRMVYDHIRKGELQRASELFNLMEQLYVELSPFALYDHVVQGFRHKLDVARTLLEGTRSAITEEVRRTELIKSINSLSKKLPDTPKRVEKLR